MNRFAGTKEIESIPNFYEKIRSSSNQVFELFISDTGIFTEFVESKEFVLRFIELFFNFHHNPETLSVTFPGNELNIFRVNANSIHCFFHTMDIYQNGFKSKT